MTGLSTAALTASTHANRPWQRSPAVLAMRCHLLRALCWLAWCSRQTSGARLDRTRRGRCGAAVGNIGAPAAAQRLWFWCKPLGYRQDRLEMRLNQPHDRMPPLRVPILTKMVVSASVASVLYALLLETTSEQQRAAAVHHSHVHRVHHVREGADDVSGLLIAALTASTRANRPWQRRPGLQAPAIRWQPEELLLLGELMQRPCRPQWA